MKLVLSLGYVTCTRFDGQTSDVGADVGADVGVDVGVGSFGIG